jgi:hypothetical protein
MYVMIGSVSFGEQTRCLDDMREVVYKLSVELGGE